MFIFALYIKEAKFFHTPFLQEPNFTPLGVILPPFRMHDLFCKVLKEFMRRYFLKPTEEDFIGFYFRTFFLLSSHYY